MRERIHTVKGVLDRSNITAPVKGTVVKLRYHTSGGVIEAGKNIMEIVSLQEELIIEARVRPQDIDKIKHSQLASVCQIACSHPPAGMNPSTTRKNA